MKKWILFIIIGNFNLFSKSYNIDNHIKKFYINKDYKSCYNLSKMINSKKFINKDLFKYKINISNKYTIISDSSEYFELMSLYKIDSNQFYYNYIHQKEKYDKYFNIENNFYNWINILNSSKILNYDKESEIIIKMKLNECYNFIDDSIKKKIFINNKEFINKIKYLNIISIDDGETKIKYIDNYINKVFETQRFVNIDHIQKYFLDDLNQIEKIIVIFSFTKNYLHYITTESHTANDIKRILIYRTTVCQGYANIMFELLSKNKFENYIAYLEVIPKTKSYVINNYHANNILVFNKKIYYLDVTWNIFYTDFKEKEKIIDINKNIYGKLEDFSYLLNDNSLVNYLNSIY